jgi:hypothetical protein
MNWSNCARRVLVADLLLVAASTFFLSDEVGKVTVLSLFLQVLPFIPIDLVASDHGESMRKVALAMSLVLNVLAFSSIALPLYFGFRRLAPRTLLVLLTMWLALYMLGLFYLFPVTHLDI